MTVLPIVGRELRVAARRRGTFWLRTLVAAGAIAASLVVLLLASRESPQGLGQALFGVITGSLLAYCLFVGVRLTADCLSEEKREVTLGLLFLTDLKGYDVVLGKLAGTSINALYSLLATFPVVALPLLLGAVAPGEIARAALVLLNTMFLSLCIGIFVSSVSYHARKAAAGTILLILLGVAGSPAFGAWLAYLSGLSKPPEVFLVPSPIYSYAYMFARPYRGDPEKFWTSVILIQLLAWLFLAMASSAARRAWHDRPASKVRLRWLETWRHWSCGGAKERLAFRQRLLEINAFFWRTARERWKPQAVWILLVCVALGWAIAAAKYGKDILIQPVYLTIAYLTAVALKLWIASEAGHTLAEDRQNGALELVLSTPLTVKEIVRGQVLALRRQFLGPLLAVLGVSGASLLLCPWDDTLQRDFTVLLALWPASMVMLVADAGALACVGMWLGVTSKSAGRATRGTVWRILVLPWLIFALVLIGLATFDSSEPDWPFFLGLWFVPGLVVDAAFGAWAWHNLHARFRQMAMARFAPPKRWWRRATGVEPLNR